MNKKGDLLHHSIIYKVLSNLLYLIAYPILFILTKLWHGLKIEGRMKKLYNERTEKNGEMQEENV